MKNNSNNIDDELLIRFLSNEATQDEASIVLEWIDSSETNKNYFEELKKIWINSESLKEFELFDTNADWQKIKTRIPFESNENVKALYPVKSKSVFYYFSRIAAVLVVALGLGILGYQLLQNKEIEILTLANEEKEVSLPDGSKVFLNANSKIVYSEEFYKKRELELFGEAFFEVVKNPQLPFKVKTNNTITEVLGTSFNIKSNKDKIKTTVTLITGSVAFYIDRNKKRRVLMTKGEQATYVNGKIEKEKTRDKNVLSWKENKLMFENSNLSSVIENLENYFHIRVGVSDQKLLNCKYTAQFEDPKLEKVIDILQATLNVQVERHGDQYVLSGEGCEN